MKQFNLKMAFAMLVLLALACGSSNSGEKVGTNGSDTSAPAQVEVYKAGDVIKVGDSTIVMNSAELQGNRVQANFTIENKGSSDLNVSSMMSFETKDSDGVKLEQDIFDCGSSFDGTVLPGDKLKGDLCWTGATTKTVKIYYKDNIFSSGAIVWEVTGQ